MQPLIPEFLDLVQKADLGTEIEGDWPLARMDRLAEMLVDTEGMVSSRLQLSRDGRQRLLVGEVSAAVQVTCQRCMQPMNLDLHAELKLGMVSDEAQADQLPDAFEPLLVGDEPTRLPDVLEDELLLAMPLVPMHDFDCSDYLQKQKQRQAEDEVQAEAEKAQQNPFSVLKDLL